MTLALSLFFFLILVLIRQHCISYFLFFRIFKLFYSALYQTNVDSHQYHNINCLPCWFRADEFGWIFLRYWWENIINKQWCIICVFLFRLNFIVQIRWFLLLKNGWCLGEFKGLVGKERNRQRVLILLDLVQWTYRSFRVSADS